MSILAQFIQTTLQTKSRNSIKCDIDKEFEEINKEYKDHQLNAMDTKNQLIEN
jgi:hypothetical protein